VDGKPVRSADDVVSAVAGKQPGDTLEIEYYRGDTKRTVKVDLAERPAELGSASPSQDSPDNGPLFPLP
jgi:S1-C subfamily serine protease